MDLHSTAGTRASALTTLVGTQSGHLLLQPRPHSLAAAGHVESTLGTRLGRYGIEVTMPHMISASRQLPERSGGRQLWGVQRCTLPARSRDLQSSLLPWPKIIHVESIFGTVNQPPVSDFLHFHGDWNWLRNQHGIAVLQ